MARIEVPMPQMGESIAEGTVSKWLKAVGDAVERDEPILEISTDKVDAEIPAPASGTLVGIEVKEGETVEVGTVVAYIDTEAMADGKKPAPAPAAAAPAAAPARAAAPAPEAPPREAPAPAPAQPVAAAPAPTRRPEPERDAPPASARPAATLHAEPQADGDIESAEERLRTRSTPVVRKIAGEHGIDIAAVPGTGHAGRVTKQDILAFIESGAPPAEEARPAATAPEAKPAAPAAPSPAASAAPSDLWKQFYGQVQHPEFPVREGDKVEPMDKIRRLTAEHMVLAKRVAPHVHSFIEIDFTRVDKIRRENKKRWEEQGVRVSFTAFVAWACSRVLTQFPTVNATISGNNIVYRGSVNVGIAVDLDPGLIVPVIKDASDLSLAGIAKRIVDLADRARKRQLTPDEIQGATFSITNPGVLGTLVGMPIIPKGTSAILGTGAIEKRPVVVEDPATGTDAIAIRLRTLFSLGYDHRLVDGADAARFLAKLKETLQEFPGGRMTLDVRRLGVVPYAEGLELQQSLVQQRRAGDIPDTLLLLEHPHVITLGSDARAEHVLADEGERRLLGIELFETGRGGDVTYHGPGQLVGYPILDLKPDRKDLHRYLRDLEQVLIDVAAAFGVTAFRREGLTGVWTHGGKLAAIGVRVSSGWITSHGFALNVSTDLRYFDSIVPCGIQGAQVTSLEREVGRAVGMDDVADVAVVAVASRFARRTPSVVK